MKKKKEGKKCQYRFVDERNTHNIRCKLFPMCDASLCTKDNEDICYLIKQKKKGEV